jgi:hypothetical protein
LEDIWQSQETTGVDPFLHVNLEHKCISFKGHWDLYPLKPLKSLT